MKRVGRIFKAWWLFGLLALLVGAGAGFLGTGIRNDSIVRVFEARATFPLTPVASGQRGETSSGPLLEALEVANEANEELLRASEEAVITTDTEAYALIFTAKDASEQAAVDTAAQLRENFVVTEFGAVAVVDRMALLLEDAVDVSLALDALTPTVTTTPTIQLDPARQARFDFLLIQAQALQDESTRLVGNLVLAEAGETRNGTVAQIQESIDSVAVKLEAIYLELATFPNYDPSMLDDSRNQASSEGGRDTTQQAGPQTATTDAFGAGGRTSEVSIPSDETEIGPDWQRAALEDRYAQLQAEYEALFVASLSGTPDALEPVESQDATADLIPLGLGTGAGAAAALLLALVGLILANRIRKPIWVASDLDGLPISAEVPLVPRRPETRRGRRKLEKRKRVVQRLRGSLLGLVESRPSAMALGLAGIDASKAELTELAADLATGINAADRTAVIIDVDFVPQHGAAAIEYNGSPTVAGLVSLSDQDPEAGRSELKRLLAPVPGNSALVLPAGVVRGDPADVLLGRSFGRFMTDVLSMVDLAFIPVARPEAPVADSIYQRVDGLLAVGRVKTTKQADLARLAERLEERRADLFGAVVLVGRKRRRSQSTHGAKQSAPFSERAKQLAPQPYRSSFARARVRTRMPTSSMRAVPDFLVIGAQRSGTSSLYKYLGQHPAVIPSIRKETEYFSSRYGEGESWYRAHFPIRRKNEGAQRMLTFEADPSYLLDPRAPLRASSLVPDAKIIVLLRDPVKRAISHYGHNVRIGKETVSLESALELENERLEGEVERMWEDPDYAAKSFLRYSYVTRGYYSDQLQRWLEFYPMERIKVVHSEDLFKNPKGAYQEILEFLDLPDFVPPHLINYSNHANGSNGSNGEAKPKVDESVLASLRGDFGPRNKVLYSLLGRHFGW